MFILQAFGKVDGVKNIVKKVSDDVIKVLEIVINIFILLGMYQFCYLLLVISIFIFKKKISCDVYMFYVFGISFVN